jgi:hypothetical protein
MHSLIKAVPAILYVSNLLFPLWLVVLMIILGKNGVRTWRAWGISSFFCPAQAYVTAKIVGRNLGGYLITIVSSIPVVIFGKDMVSKSVTSVLFWIIPPFVSI